MIHSRLTPKQDIFLRHYLQSWNGADAARKAGYARPHNVVACKLLSAPEVKAAVRQKLAVEGLTSEFIRAQLSMIAHASVTDFLDVDETTGSATFNMAKAERLGSSQCAKRITIRDGKVCAIEMRDSLNALNILARLLGLYEPNQPTEKDDSLLPWFWVGGDPNEFKANWTGRKKDAE